MTTTAVTRAETHLIEQLVDRSLDHRATIARAREEFDARRPA
ncbi:hypothetical protein [Streptomyces sp. NPDC051921]